MFKDDLDHISSFFLDNILRLERDESLRLTASQLVQHSWLDGHSLSGRCHGGGTGNTVKGLCSGVSVAPVLGTHKRPTTMIDLKLHAFKSL